MYSTNTKAASMSRDELQQRLDELGITPTHLAALCGVDERAVRRWLAYDGVKTAHPAPAYVRTVLALYERRRPADSLFRKEG